jgi:hypothetical protein
MSSHARLIRVIRGSHTDRASWLTHEVRQKSGKTNCNRCPEKEVDDIVEMSKIASMRKTNYLPGNSN